MGAGGAGKGAAPGNAAAGEQADELCRLVGRIVCTEQEVANRVERCVASRRDIKYASAYMGLELGRYRLLPGTGGIPAPHTFPEAIPGRAQNMGRKVKYLKIFWRDMAKNGRRAINEEDFASHVRDSHNSRNAIAHCVIACGGSAVRNARLDREYSRRDLEEQLERTRHALDLVVMLCRHLGLPD